MKQSNRLSIVTIILCAVLLGCMFFPLLKIDLSSVMEDSIPFSEQLQGVSDFLGLSAKEHTLEVTGKAIFGTVNKDTQNLGSMGKELILFLRILIISICICSLLLVFLSIVQKGWARIMSLLLTALGCIGSILGLLWFLPSRLSSMIADRAGDTVSAVVTRITESTDAGAAEVPETMVETADIRKLVLQGIRPALWVALAVLALLLIISFLRIFMKGSKENVSGTSTFSQPSFKCSDGPLAGEIIPIGPKDEISFGSDPAYANMVIQRNDISSLHCKISFNQERGTYKVQVFDNAPVLLKGKRLKNGENDLKRDSEIFLGYGTCSILLL